MGGDLKLNQEKEIEKVIDELFVLFKNNLERKTEVDWENAEIFERELIRFTINSSTFEVDFRQKPIVMSTYYTSLEKKEYKQVDVEYRDGKWILLNYSDLKFIGEINELIVNRIINDYLYFATAK